MKNPFRLFYESLTSEMKELFLSQKEKAFILTLVLMILIVLSMLIFHLNNKPQEIMIEFQVPKDDFVDVEQLLEQEKLLEQQDMKVTTTAYNETDKSLKHSEEVFKTLEELMAEQSQQDTQNQESTQENDAEENSTENLKIPSIDDNPKQEVKEEKSVPETKQVNKNSFVKYSLQGRTEVNLPIPIYTCDASGIIVINVEVNELGFVEDTSVNEKASNSKNGCLVEQAIRYAKDSRFSKSSKKRQIGTITYYFQPKY